MGSDTDFPVPVDLLALLRCPETLQRLAPADPGLLTRLEARRLAGGLHDRAGNRINDVLSAALLREDGKIVYPVRDGIPILLIDSGIPVD
jgi:uncharacterized protein YbaR (Trm112 family)